MSSKPPFKQNKKKVVKAPNYKAIGASIDRVKEISYNEHDRKDYLTGFHRRKVARREYAQKKIEEKEKREKAEQKKFVKLQREAFQQSIIDSRKKHENEFGIENDEEEEEEEIKEEETIDEKGNKVKVLIKPSTIQETQIKEYSSEDKIITTTVKPLSFNSDGEDEDESDDNNNNSSDEEEEEEEDDDEDDEEVNDKSKVKKKLPNFKKESPSTNKFNNNKKDTITADGLTLIDAENKIYQDEKGRRIKMRKEKGKIIPVVLTAAAETAIEKGWKLPRSLRTSQKKSWSHAVQKKSKKKQRKEKKGK
ncbi:hypothetical protein ACTFIY_010426 [Dictyostelium cf. discoideum]